MNKKTASIEPVVLIVLFLIAGTLGHDPWKQDETYSFGIIHHFLKTHTWLVPVNAGIAFMEKPPLYYWTAVVFTKVFGGVLMQHDTARLASFCYMLITVRFLWLTSQVLFASRPDRKTLGWITITLLLGSAGLVRHAHDMFTDVALLSGTTITLYGFALLACAPERFQRSGFWIGAGYGVAFLSKGLFVPALLGATGVAMLVALPEVRTRRTLRALLIALATAAPFLLLWPVLLYRHSPTLFMEWFWENNVGRFLGFSVGKLGAGNEPFYFLRSTPWFAFPGVWFAAAETLSRIRCGWRKPEYLLPLAVAVIGLTLLCVSASARALYLIPLLPAFALLGAPALSRLPAAALIRWNALVRILISVLALLLWCVWWSLHRGAAGPLAPLAHFAGRWLPLDFVPAASEVPAVIMAGVLSGFWIASLRFDMRTPLNTARIWLAAVAVVWGVAMTLLLPWIDAVKSYRIPLAEMLAAAHASPYKNSPIGSYDLGESLAPMLEYATDQTPVNQLPKDRGPCTLLFTRAKMNVPTDIDPNWHLIWSGARPLDPVESLRLYSR